MRLHTSPRARGPRARRRSTLASAREGRIVNHAKDAVAPFTLSAQIVAGLWDAARERRHRTTPAVPRRNKSAPGEGAWGWGARGWGGVLAPTARRRMPLFSRAFAPAAQKTASWENRPREIDRLSARRLKPRVQLDQLVQGERASRARALRATAPAARERARRSRSASPTGSTSLAACTRSAASRASDASTRARGSRGASARSAPSSKAGAPSAPGREPQREALLDPAAAEGVEADHVAHRGVGGQVPAPALLVAAAVLGTARKPGLVQQHDPRAADPAEDVIELDVAGGARLLALAVLQNSGAPRRRRTLDAEPPSPPPQRAVRTPTLWPRAMHSAGCTKIADSTGTAPRHPPPPRPA